MKRVGRYLQREKRSWAWLASQVGVSPQYLSMVRHGHRGCSWKIATGIERVTGINARLLMDARKAAA